jgi:acyl-coenzyme A synthetase/AMP-(fatty) acid ligase
MIQSTNWRSGPISTLAHSPKPFETQNQRAYLLAYCKTHLTNYKAPKSLEFTTELPHTYIGKVLRRQLWDEKQRSRAA